MKVIRAMSVTYQPEAVCAECDFVTLPSRHTRDQAKRHVQDTGHEVRVVTETVDLYTRTD